MKSMLIAVTALVLGGTSLASAEERTWYVYCEGYGHGMHWAVFSENYWQHRETESYARHVASRAEEFFEQRSKLTLQGCSGVGFIDRDQADYSRQRTARLHKSMGDQVHFFRLPDELLRE